MDLMDGIPSQTRGILITCIVVPIITSMFVLLRLWTRVFVSRSLAYDDYVAAITLPFCISYSVGIGIASHYGMGLPTWALSPSRFAEYSKWSYISAFPYLFSLLGYKMAILLLYLRLFDISQRFKYATWMVMFVVFGYLFANFLTQFLACTPTMKYWVPATPGHCINIKQADIVFGSMNVVSDFFIFVLPLPMVWNLKLARREKIGVSLVFMSGAIAFVVAIVRFSRGFQSFHPTDRNQLASEIGNRTLLEINTILEINTGLICGCTPALKHFFRQLSLRWFVVVESQNSEQVSPFDRSKKPAHFSPDLSLESGIYHSKISVDITAEDPSNWRIGHMAGEHASDRIQLTDHCADDSPTTKLTEVREEKMKGFDEVITC